MTAKEMVKNCAKQIKFTNKEPLEHFIFLKKDLESFVSQLCKEQRGLCVVNIEKHIRKCWDDTVIVDFSDFTRIIEETEQPKIFEGGK